MPRVGARGRSRNNKDNDNTTSLVVSLHLRKPKNALFEMDSGANSRVLVVMARGFKDEVWCV
jgi:hypothetical protein